MPEQLVHKFGRIEAIRFGDANGEWDEGAVARIAQFVLGTPVTSSITPLNEQLMKVVMPVDEFWDPKNGLADVVITDPKSGTRIGLGLGQWLARYPSKNLRPLPHNVVVAAYLPPPPKESFESELKALLVRHDRTKGSGIPDYVLAEFVADTIASLNTAVRKRSIFLNEGKS